MTRAVEFAQLMCQFEHAVKALIDAVERATGKRYDSLEELLDASTKALAEREAEVRHHEVN